MNIYWFKYMRTIFLQKSIYCIHSFKSFYERIRKIRQYEWLRELDHHHWSFGGGFWLTLCAYLMMNATLEWFFSSVAMANHFQNYYNIKKIHNDSKQWQTETIAKAYYLLDACLLINCRAILLVPVSWAINCHIFLLWLN